MYISYIMYNIYNIYIIIMVLCVCMLWCGVWFLRSRPPLSVQKPMLPTTSSPWPKLAPAAATESWGPLELRKPLGLWGKSSQNLCAPRNSCDSVGGAPKFTARKSQQHRCCRIRRGVLGGHSKTKSIQSIPCTQIKNKRRYISARGFPCECQHPISPWHHSSDLPNKVTTVAFEDSIATGQGQGAIQNAAASRQNEELLPPSRNLSDRSFDTCTKEAIACLSHAL